MLGLCENLQLGQRERSGRAWNEVKVLASDSLEWRVFFGDLYPGGKVRNAMMRMLNVKDTNTQCISESGSGNDC